MDNSWAVVKTNRMVFIINAFVGFALTAGYIGEVFKGTKTLGFVLIFLAFVAVQVSVPAVVFFRNKASGKFKYYAILSYLALYCFGMFQSPTLLTFLFIYPMIVLFVLYLDINLMKCIGFGLVITNAAKVVYQIYNGLNAPDDTTDYTIQMAAAALVAFGLYFVTKLTVQINDGKIRRILETHETLKNNASELHLNINSQTQKTKDIADAGTEIELLSDDMTGIAKESRAFVRFALGHIGSLDRATAKVNENSGKVYDNIENLNILAHEISSNAKAVSKIALNTNILALNASVEASRSGEHNKGFMAVAEEIRELAEQSNKAAGNINDIIESLEIKSTESLDEIKSFISNTEVQNKQIESVKSTFGDIDSKTDMLLEKIDVLHKEIKKLSAANRDIMSSAENLNDIASRTVDI
ncbi:MAG: methyl-accepting chemotaxis protein [Oscillospiraceae bacterium]|nr:methyl-accepting chemotaxis protein [Oscillospiraceae bacterium]